VCTAVTGRWLSRLAVSAIAGVALLVVAASRASGHPTGDLSVNTYTGIVVAPGEVRLRFAMDMAELVTSYEMPVIDTNVDGEVSEEEARAYAGAKAAELLDRQSLTVDGEPVSMSVQTAEMELIPGSAGLPYLRLDVTYVGKTDAESGTVLYVSELYPQAEGWREITAVGVAGRKVSGSTVPEESNSDGLRAYPVDAVGDSLRVVRASFAFGPGPGAVAPEAPGVATSAARGRPKGADAGFAALLTRPPSGAVLALSLLLAVGFGVLHALAPGHAKSLTAAYLVGSGVRLRQAAGVGVAVALMHTGSVVALFLIAQGLRVAFPVVDVYGWLGLAAGLLALGLGAWMLTVRVRAWRRGDGLEPAHGHEHGGEHGLIDARTAHMSRPGLVALAAAGGLVPSPGALLVLTASVAAGRTLFGLGLVLAFSLGLAAALAAIGTVAVGARLWTSEHLAGRLARAVPIAGAAGVVVVGGFLTVRAAFLL
jgi:nickel/cobalt transporter (NicO) family protein